MIKFLSTLTLLAFAFSAQAATHAAGTPVKPDGAKPPASAASGMAKKADKMEKQAAKKEAKEMKKDAKKDEAKK